MENVICPAPVGVRSVEAISLRSCGRAFKAFIDYQPMVVSIGCISRWARRSARHRASDAGAMRLLRGQTGIAGTNKKSKKYFLLMWGL